MINANSLGEIGAMIRDARSAVVFVRTNPTLDQTLVSLALASSLQQAGIQTDIACADLGSVLTTYDEFDFSAIKDTVGNRNLTVSFPYQEESVENVSYHINESADTFYLVIKPQPGAEPLQADQVSFDYSGFEADLVFLVGIHDWEQLDYLYEAHEQALRNSRIVSIHNVESELTPFQLDTDGFGSMSEAMSWLLEGMHLEPSSEGATYLLRGIEQATNSFQSLSATADTFEAVAKLLRLGARRSPARAARTNSSPSRQPAASSQSSSRNSNLSNQPTKINESTQNQQSSDVDSSKSTQASVHTEPTTFKIEKKRKLKAADGASVPSEKKTSLNPTPSMIAGTTRK